MQKKNSRSPYNTLALESYNGPMYTRLLSTAEDLAMYDRFVRNHPQGTLWQSLEWKHFQESLGREVRIYALLEGTQMQASALVVIDRTAFGFSAWDIPRGPIWGFGNRNSDLGLFLKTIVNDARQDHSLCLYLSPPTALSATRPTESSGRASYQLQASSRHEQPAATRFVDLTRTEEQILAQMKPKGRYNISVAAKHGIRVQQSQDIPAFMHILKQTGQRDNFSIHPARHYEAFLKELPGSFLLLAWATQTPTPVPSPDGGGVPRRGGVGDETPVAGLLGVIWGLRGIYYYGASDYAHRTLMAPYALQWAAMRHCRNAGCASYDLLGIAPPAVATAMAGKPDAPPDHSWQGHGGRDRQWQGVSGFKEKFGGSIVLYPPEQEIVFRPLTNKLLQLKRRLLG